MPQVKLKCKKINAEKREQEERAQRINAEKRAEDEKKKRKIAENRADDEKKQRIEAENKAKDEERKKNAVVWVLVLSSVAIIAFKLFKNEKFMEFSTILPFTTVHPNIDVSIQQQQNY